MTVGIAEEILTFLQGTKNGERCPACLYIPTKVDGVEWALEDRLLKALSNGRDVVVAGSAGGGKTSLIDAMQRRATDLEVGLTFQSGMVVQGKPTADSGGTVVSVLSDLTEIPAGERQSVIESLHAHGPLLMAANEGAISEAEFQGPLEQILSNLHDMQNALPVGDETRPVVVDLAGISSLGDRLVSILVSPEVRDAVAFFEAAGSAGCGDSESCSRLEALSTLDERMAGVVAKLAEAALGPREITFRQVWEFVYDVMLGGRCDGVAPECWHTSAWFWRVFYGNSLISGEIRSRFAPEKLAFPVLEDDLYYGDWDAIFNRTGEKIVRPPNPPVRSEMPSETMKWLKAQAFFLDSLQTANLERNVEHQAGVVGDLKASRTDSFVQLLNAYFRGLSPKGSDPVGLELWGALGIQRRTDRDRGLVRFALVPPNHLAIEESIVVGNLSGVDIRGARQFLVVRTNESDKVANLPITARLIDALGRGRSSRTSDRANDDTEEAYWSFVTSALDVYGVAVGQDLVTTRPRRGDVPGVAYSWRIADSQLILTGQEKL